MIKASNITKTYDDSKAVDNVSFSVECGETLVLLGTSGCGKTTTLKMINRLIEPTSGKIVIEGRDIQKQKPEDLRKQIGYVIQSIGLFPHHTVEENIGIVPNLLNWDKQRITRRHLYERLLATKYRSKMLLLQKKITFHENLSRRFQT